MGCPNGGHSFIPSPPFLSLSTIFDTFLGHPFPSHPRSHTLSFRFHSFELSTWFSSDSTA